MCYLKLNEYENVIEDCTKSMHFDPEYDKSYLRRAEAYKKLCQFEKAIKDCQAVLFFYPNHKYALTKLKLLRSSLHDVANG